MLVQFSRLSSVLTNRREFILLHCYHTFPVQGCKRDLTSGKATMSDIGYGKKPEEKKTGATGQGSQPILLLNLLAQTLVDKAIKKKITA